MFQTIQSIYTQADTVLSDVLDLGWKILPFIVIILVLAYVFEALRSGRSNYTELLWRVGIAVIAIVSYKWWSVQIATVIIEIAKLFKNDQGISSYYDVVIGLFKSHAGNEARWFEVGLQFRGFLYYTLLWFSVAIVVLATVFFEMVQFWGQAFLWILGPLAIVLTLFPNFKGAFVNWLNRFIGISFWSVLYMLATKIFNALIASTFTDLWTENRTGIDVTGQGFVIMKLILFSLAFFFAIIRIPAMTEWFTKHSFASISYMIATGAALGADKIMSASRGAATMVTNFSRDRLGQVGNSIARKIGGS